MPVLGDGVVVRVFRAWPHEGAADELERRLLHDSVELVTAAGGCLAFAALGPYPDGRYEFVTTWTDLEAIVAFAGPQWEESVLPSGYDALLRRHKVEHVRQIGAGTVA